MSPLKPDWIPLGSISKAHGIQGAVVVSLLNPVGQSLQPGVIVKLVSSHSERREAIQQAEKNRILFNNITTRNEAEKLTGMEVWIQRSDLQVLESDEIYLADLMGYQALDLQGKVLGQVTGFSDNKAQVLVQIGDTLVPFVKPILIQIDEVNKRIILDLPEGYEL